MEGNFRCFRRISILCPTCMDSPLKQRIRKCLLIFHILMEQLLSTLKTFFNRCILSSLLVIILNDKETSQIYHFMLVLSAKANKNRLIMSIVPLFQAVWLSINFITSSSSVLANGNISVSWTMSGLLNTEKEES